MNDYISREALILDLLSAGKIGKLTCIDIIKRAPAADVRPVVRGEWGIGKRVQPCTNCKYNGHKSWNFCPNCGADMRGKEDGADGTGSVGT